MSARRPRDRPRLRLHRETLRSLSTRHLVRVAGGYVGEDPDPMVPGAPRSNAWTAKEDETAGVALCQGWMA